MCNGASTGILEVAASGSSGTYQFSLDGTAWQSAGLFSGIQGGTYPVQVRDLNVTSCVKILSPSVTISQPDAINFANPVVTDITCNGLTNGGISATATGGTGVLAYTLKLNGTATANTSGAASGVFTGLSAGNQYVVEVQDANNCGPVSTSGLTITEPAVITFGTATVTDISCNGLTNGNIQAVATGGTGTLSYTLKLNGTETSNTSGASSGQFTGLAAGSGYVVEVKDINNCGPVSTTAYNIAEPSVISITQELATKTTGAGLSDGSINVTAQGGTGTLSFILNSGNPQDNGTFPGLPKGTYTVKVSDANGCGPVSSSSLIIDDPTGIDLIKGGYVKLYPNPARELAYLEVNRLNTEILKVEVKSLTGKAAMVQSFEDVTDGFKAKLELDQLPKGIYMIVVNGIALKDKLVIQ